MAEREIRLEKANAVELRDRWCRICDDFSLRGAGIPEIMSSFDKVAAQYAREGYHNLDHLSFMFRLLDNYRSMMQNHAIVDFAVFFHDVVYIPGSTIDEEKNALYARDMLFSMGTGFTTVDEVNRLITASKDHVVEAGARDDLHFFLDADMAILGSDKESYKRYRKGVAKDYDSIDPKLYLQGRLAFLRELVGKRIFSTDEMHQRFHQRAQTNIGTEIAFLEGDFEVR